MQQTTDHGQLTNLFLRRLLLDTDCLTLPPAAGARVRARALAAHRHPLAVAQPTVAGNIHQALDIQLNLAAQITLNAIFTVDHVADAPDFFLGQVTHSRVRVHVGLLEDVYTIRSADPRNIGDRDLYLLVPRNIHPS